MTCWRRLAVWHGAGLWDQMHRALMTKLRSAKKLGRSWEVIHSSCTGRSVRSKSGRRPVDRARPGSKSHLIHDAQGIPLAVSLNGGSHPTSLNSCPCSARSPPSQGVCRPALALPRRLPSLAAATTTTITADCSGPAAYARRSRPAWASSDTWSSARSPGCLASPNAHPMGTSRRHPRIVLRPRHLPDHPLSRPTPLLGPPQAHAGVSALMSPASATTRSRNRSSLRIEKRTASETSPYPNQSGGDEICCGRRWLRLILGRQGVCEKSSL